MGSDHFTNLRQHRSETDAWKPRGWRDRMADDPRALSLIPIAGAALLLYEATRHRAVRNFWWLISGAAVGCAVASIGVAQWRGDLRSADETADIVTRESEDSFPASDAPSSNATTATAQPQQTDF